MGTDNPWQLYSSIPGWEEVSARLDKALARALAGLDRLVTSGTPVSLAAFQTFQDMLKIMSKPSQDTYGATDSEARWYLASRIQKHIREIHKVKYFVDRFGDVTEH